MIENVQTTKSDDFPLDAGTGAKALDGLWHLNPKEGDRAISLWYLSILDNEWRIVNRKKPNQFFTFKTDTSVRPNRIRLYKGDLIVQHGIFKIEGDLLWLNLTNSENPIPEKFATKRAEFRRSKPSNLGAWRNTLQDSWPQHRGNSWSSGQSISSLPDKPDLLWKIKRPEAEFIAVPVVVDDTVFIADKKNHFYGLDLQTGEVKWTYASKDGFSGIPAVKDNRVFIGDFTGVLHCISTSGEPLWKFETDGPINSGASFYRDWVLIGSMDGHLYWLEAESGELVWKYDIGDQIQTSPTIVGQTCLIAACDGHLHIFSIGSGKRVGKIKFDAPTIVTPAVDGEQAFLGTEAGEIFAIDWFRKKVDWQVQIDKTEQSIRSSPAITINNGMTAMIFGSHSKKVFAATLESGAKLWEFKTDAIVDSSPVTCGPRVFFGTNKGKLISLDVSNGRPIWQTELGGATTSPAIARDRLVVANDRGEIFCFGKKAKR